jgi:DNA-binding CsgD family transcriptional regulator
MGISQEQLDQLILEIHAAPLDGGSWQSVVRSVAGATGADSALLFAFPTAPGLPFWNVSMGISPELLAPYATEFAAEDVWSCASVRRGLTHAGVTLTGEQLIPRRDYHRSRFYGEFLNPLDIDRFMNLALREPAAPGQPASAVLSLYRRPQREAFEAAEVAMMERLKPHLLLAARTFWSLQSMATQAQGAFWTINALSTPLIILDEAHNVLHANLEAERLLGPGGVFRCQSGRLMPVSGIRGTQRLQQGLAQLRTGRASLTEVSLNGRQLMVSMAPIGGVADVLNFWPRAAGLVWIATGVVKTSPLAQVGSVFNLTFSELRLVRQLIGGLGVADAAAVSGISVHTTRTQLKSVQRKTGWHSQTEMVRMLGQLGAVAPEAGT